MRTNRLHSLRRAFWAVVLLSLGGGVACVGSKNDLQDVDSGPSKPVLQSGDLTGAVVLQGVEKGTSSPLFTGVIVTASQSADGIVIVGAPSLAMPTGDSGQWTITGLPVGTYKVEAKKAGYKTASADVKVEGSLITSSPDLTLLSTGNVVSGCVKFPGKVPDGNAVTAQLNSGTTAIGSALTLTTATCSDGQTGYPFLFQNVVAGAYTVKVSTPGYVGFVPTFNVLDVDVALPIILASRVVGKVQGTILVNDTDGTGLPVLQQGVTATLGGDEAVAGISPVLTDSTGTYTFNDVPVSPTGGAYTVTLSGAQLTYDGLSTGSATATVTVLPNAVATAAPVVHLKIATYTVSGCVIVPAPAPTAAGVVASLAGTALIGPTANYQLPAAGSTTTFLSTATMQLSNACIPGVANSGRYTISGVPAGSFSITLARPGYEAVVVPNVNVVASNVTLPPVSLARATVSFSGIVRASDGGTGIPGPDAGNATITLTGLELLGQVLQTTTPTSNADPKSVTYKFFNVPISLAPTGNSYAVTASKPGYISSASTFRYGPSSRSIGSPTHLLAAVSNQVTGCVVVPPSTTDLSTVSLTVDLVGNAFDGSVLSPPRSQKLDATAMPCATSDFPGLPGWAYAFAYIPNGTYSIRVSGAGYQRVSMTNFPVAANTNVPVVSLVRDVGTVTGAAGADANGTGLAASVVGSVATVTGADLLGASFQGVVDGTQKNLDGTYNYAVANVPISPGQKPYTITMTKPGYTGNATATATVATTPAGASNPITMLINTSPVSVCVVLPQPGTDSSGVRVTLGGTALATGETFPVAPATALASVGAACGPNLTGLTYRLATVPDGTYTVQVAASGFETIIHQNVLVANAPVTLPTDTLRRTTGSVTGSISQADGGTQLSTISLVGATVSIGGGDLLGSNLQTVTNAAGGFAFQSVPVSPTNQSYTITVTKPHYRSNSSTIAVVQGLNPPAGQPASPAIQITLASSNVSGCVSAPLPGPDASGIVVTISGTAFDGTAYPPTGKSAIAQANSGCASGTGYRFATVPDGTYTVTYVSNGFNAVATSNVLVNGSDVLLPSTSLTRSTGTVAGIVTASDSLGTGLTSFSAGVQGAVVTLSGTDLLGSVLQTSVDPTTGRFTFTNVPASPKNNLYSATVSQANYTATSTNPLSVSVTATATTPSMLFFQTAISAATVTGCVVLPAPATSAAGVTVKLSGTAFDASAFAQTKSPSGTCPNLGAGQAGNLYTFTKVPNGAYNLQFSFAGYATAVVTGITVYGGSPTSVPTQTLSRVTVSLSGSISVNANGTGVQITPADVAGATATISTGGAVVATAQTDSLGNWSVSALPVPLATVTYTATVGKAGFTLDATTPPVAVVISPTTTAPVSVGIMALDVLPSAVTGCVIVPAPAQNTAVTVSLSGTAFNGSSYPRVDLVPLVATTTLTTCGPSNTGNAFSFPSVPNGTYNVTYNHAGYDPLTPTGVFTVTGSAVVLANQTLVRSTGTITGSVATSDAGTGLTVDGSALTVTLASTNSDLFGLSPQATTDSSGNFKITGVPVSPSATAYNLGIAGLTTATSKAFNFTLVGSPTVVVVANTTIGAPTVQMRLKTYAVSGTILVPAPALDSAGASAAISGTAFNGVAWTGAAPALTLPNGSYTFPAVPASNSTGYQITFSRSGYTALTVSGVVVPTTGAATNGTPLTQGGGSINGTITVSANGTGLTLNPGMIGNDNQNFSVTLQGIGFAQSYTFTTDTNGAWPSGGGLANVTSGTYSITFSKTGFTTLSATATVATGVTTTVPAQSMAVAGFSLTGNMSVEGTGVDSGVAGLITGTAFNGTSFTKSADAASSATGAISFSNIPAGSSYTVTFTKTGYTSLVETQLVVAAPPASLPNLSGLLRRSANNVAGCVVVPAPASDWSNVDVVLSGTDYNGAAQTFPATGTVLSSANCSSANSTNYSFANVPDGNYSLSLTLNGYETFALSGITVAGADVLASTAHLSRATSSISGTVIASPGAFIGFSASATGAIASLAGGELLGVPYQTTVFFDTTSSSYKYTFSNVPISPSGTKYNLTLTEANYASSTASTPAQVLLATPAAAAAPVVTVTVITSTVSGCIVVPPPGVATLPVSLSGTSFDGNSRTATATASGACSGGQPGLAYNFPGVLNGVYTVQVNNLVGYDNLSLTNVSVASTASGATVTVPSARMQRSLGTISGTVTTSASGTDLTADATGATVTLAGVDLSGGLYQTTVTGGTYSLTSVPLNTGSNNYTVTVGKPNYTTPASTTVTLSSSTATASAMALAMTAYTLPGTVTVDGVNQAGVTATLSGTAFDGTAYILPSATRTTAIASSAAGTFSFTAVPAGTYSVTLALTGNNSYAPVVVSPVLLPGTSTVTGALRRGTGTVAGQVSVGVGTVTATGFSIGSADKAGVVVAVSDATLSATFATVTDSNGNFAVPNVPAPVGGTGSYTITASKLNFSTSTGTVTVSPNQTVAPATGLAITANVGSVAALVFLNDAAQNSFAGLNTAPTGIPMSLIGSGFNGTSITASANTVGGAVSFTGLPPGNYLVSALAQNLPTLTLHNSDGPKATTVPTAGGAGSAVTINLTDTLAPTAPVISLVDPVTSGVVIGPSSATSVNVNLIQASADLTKPNSNFWNYQVQLCRVSSSGVESCTSKFSWDGSSPFQFPNPSYTYTGVASPVVTAVPSLFTNADNYIFVTAQDDNQNVSTPAVGFIHVGTVTPATPTGVHVDNRPGSAFVSWNAVLPSSLGLPIAGYKVYYGPVSSTSASAYTGVGAAQGPSPIDVGNKTSITLTGLQNGSSFYVAVAAYDTAIDNGANVSALSATASVPAAKVLPNIFPFDRAVHSAAIGGTTAVVPAGTYGTAQSMAVFRDDVIVSTGLDQNNRYDLLPFRYSQYGSLQTLVPAGTSFNNLPHASHSKVIVPDGNLVAFGYDPASKTVDGIEFDPATGTPTAATTNTMLGPVDHLVLLHRLGSNMSSTPVGASHGVYTLTNSSKQWISTFSFTPSGFSTIQPDTLSTTTATLLTTQSVPCDLKASGNFAFTLHSQALNGYTLPADFGNGPSKNAMTAAVAIPGAAGTCGTMVVDWPRIFFSGGPGNQNVYRTQITSISPLTFDSTTPTLVGTLAGGATKMLVVGNQLLIGEQINNGVIAVEAFSLNAPTALVRDGTYEINSNGEMSTGMQVTDMQLSGSNLFLLFNSPTNPTAGGWVDVVELGGPRAMQEVGEFSSTGSSGTLIQGLSAGIRGSRAIGYMADGAWTSGSQTSQVHIASVDLTSNFSASSVANALIGGNTQTTTDTSQFGTTHSLTLPMALYGDYAFFGIEAPMGGSPHSVLVYDMSSASSVSSPTLLGSIAMSAPITDLAVENEFLYVAEDSTSSWLERVDISTIATGLAGPLQSPVIPMGVVPGKGLAVKVAGYSVYVSTTNGYCQVQSNGSLASAFTVQACVSPNSPTTTATNAIDVNAGNIFVTLGAPFAALGIDIEGPLAVPITASTPLKTLGFNFGTSEGLSLRGTGQYLFATFVDPNGTSGLAGFDTAVSLSTPVGQLASLKMASRGAFGVSGPFILLPDAQRGLVLVESY